MRAFMDESFLLTNETARALYFGAAKEAPVMDWHGETSVKALAQNAGFCSAAEFFIDQEPTARELMRSVGVDTVDGASDDERFFAFARALPRLMGSPFYALTHLLLARVFSVHTMLSEETAPAVLEQVNAALARENLKRQPLLSSLHVEWLSTPQDPVDELSFHRSLALCDTLSARVLPAFCPDQALMLSPPDFPEYIQKLELCAQMPIRCTKDMIEALSRRADFFAACGARVATHSLPFVPFGEMSLLKADKAFKAALNGEPVKSKHMDSYRTILLCALSQIYENHGWAQEYRIGFSQESSASSCAWISDAPLMKNLSRLLSAQAEQGTLPKTILTLHNPSDALAAATLPRSLQTARIRLSLAWDGALSRAALQGVLDALLGAGQLCASIGFSAGGASALGVFRHDYFRRVLCSTIGELVENGEYPNDLPALCAQIEGICAGNVKEWLTK